MTENLRIKISLAAGEQQQYGFPKHATIKGDSSRCCRRRFERNGDSVLVHRTIATKFGVQPVGLGVSVYFRGLSVRPEVAG
eukprot:2640784-Pleurochrysis_carterae.AAC.1